MTATRKMHPSRNRQDRRRADLDAIDRLMRERVSLSPAPVPVPLHKMGAARGERDDDTESETT